MTNSRRRSMPKAKARASASLGLPHNSPLEPRSNEINDGLPGTGKMLRVRQKIDVNRLITD